MNNKVYGSDDLCRFCKEEDETFDHLINECHCFYLDWVDLLQNQPIAHNRLESKGAIRICKNCHNKKCT